MTTKILYSFLPIYFLSLFILKAQDEPVLFTIGDEKVTKSEFKYIYEKNNSKEEDLYSKEDVNEYLDLYTKFKLKVKAAKAAGVDTTDKFIREFKTYRDQLARPYLSDKEVTEELIEEAYERMKYEVRASHILITVAPDAKPQDTLKAYNQIKEVREKALAGEDFGELAVEYSDDPTAATNKGDLGYFTVFHMIYPFETAAYNLKEDEISKIIRTRFGYHIVKLKDKRPNRGEMTAAHIMIAESKEAKSEDGNSRAKVRIDSIYQKLKAGAEFEKMVERYSEDASSKKSGGKLPKFNSFTSYLPEEFKDQAFALSKDGEISEPFQTQYGWHIVKRTSAENIKSMEESRDYLRNRISRDERSSKSEKAAIKKIKDKRNFEWVKKGRKAISKQLDTNLLNGNWTIEKPKKLEKPIFEIDGKEYSALEFAYYIEERQSKEKIQSVEYALDHLLSEYADEKIMEYEDTNLEKFYPEFRNLVKEYKEGIMLFEITDQEVWSKAMKDTSGLEKFYEEHKTNYMYGKRLDVNIFICQDEKVASSVKKMIQKGTEPEKIESELNKKDALNVTLEEGKFEKGSKEVLENVEEKKGIYDVKKDGNVYLVQVKDIIEPEPKPLNEIRGLVIADYQDYLEKQWIEDLREKYPVNINENILQSFYK